MSASLDLANKVIELQRRITAMERSSQGGRRSIEAGALRVYDAEGNEVLSIGKQADESYQIVGSNGGKVVADDVTQEIRDTLALADGAVTEAKLAASAVTSTKIANDAVSTPKIIAGAVQALHIAAGAVTTGALAADSVTAAKIAALALTADKIAANAITSDKIAANSITAGKLAAVLTLTTRLLAGDPEAQRIELNADGLFAFDEEGSATFSVANNSPDFLSVRNAGQTTASISEDGVISGSELTVNRITLAGEDFTSMDTNKPQGVVAYADITTDDAFPWPTTSSEIGVIELSFDALANRMYTFKSSNILLSKDTADRGSLGMRVRYTSDGTKPTLTSPSLTTDYATDDYGGGFETVLLNKPLLIGALPYEVRMLVTLFTTGGGVAVINAGTSNTFYIEDKGPVPDEIGVANTGGATSVPVKKTYTKTYTATWARSYQGAPNYAWRSDITTVNQGYYSDEHGNQRGFIGFPTAVKADIGTAVINKMELYLYFQHWQNSSGGTAIIGFHGLETPASSALNTGHTVGVTTSANWPKPGGRWVTLPSTVYANWKSGTWCGVVLGPGPNTNSLYYGKANGVAAAYKPMLRITYTK